MGRVEKNTNSKKFKLIVVIIAILVLAIIAFVASKKIKASVVSTENKIPVQAVSIITGDVAVDQNKFAGMVVSEKTIKIQKDNNKTIKKVYVEVGDEVKTGDKLFEYDTDDINIKIDETNLEIEKMQNSITNSQKQIENINAEIASNPGSDVAAYNIEIQTLQNDIKQTEYNIKSKSNEIAKLRKSLKNVVIKSEIDGIVQSINDSENSQDNSNYGMTSESDDK